MDKSEALEQYKHGEISLGRFAELTGLSYEDALDYLKSQGVQIYRGSATVEEMKGGAKELLKSTTPQ